MIEVGIRELKSRLSYYVQLMEAGETIAIMVRKKIVGFFSPFPPTPSKEKSAREPSRRDMQKLIAQWKKDGFVISGGKPYKYRPVKRVRMKGGHTAQDMIRQMRDEGL